MSSTVKKAFYLLVMALLVVGLAACEQSAPERETEATEAPEGTAPAVGGDASPEPGQTVVSAVTPESPSPGGEEQPATQVPAVGTPGSSEPQATEAPAPTQEEPSAPEQPPAEGEGSVIFHTVQQGDTLYSIARQYDTTAQAISSVNGLTNPDQIFVGQKLKIPTSSEASPGRPGGCRIRHTVKQGEWVWQIARNYGVDPNRILAANGLTIQSANTIYPGTILCIP
jgi:LysM repeat protein